MNGEQGTMTEIATFLLDLMLTMVLYGAFPMVFAVTRKKAIKDRKYAGICYAVNLLIKFTLYQGNMLNLAPCLLWTIVFSRFGITILGNRGVPAVAPENRGFADEETEVIVTEPEGESVSHAPADMPQRKESTFVKTLAKVVKNDDTLCPYCGFVLLEGSAFCSHCGKAVETTEFDIEDGVLKNYTGPGGNVVIPSNVTKIGNLAFCGRKEITSVVIPDGVTEIKDEAFFTCHSLTSITIPASVASIGEGVFDECYELTIRAPKGSFAAHYAADNGINYVAE